MRWVVGVVWVMCSAMPTVAQLPREFVTSYWYGPPAKFTSLETYQRIKDANFNVVFPPGPPDASLTREQNIAILDICQKLGLRVVLFDPRMPRAMGGDARAKIDAIVADYGKHPALMAYFIVDEPSAGDFDKLGAVMKYLKQRDPRHPGFINLFPMHAQLDTQLGTKSYDEYLDRYIKAVDPFVISYDHYPFHQTYDQAEFFPNLALIRNASINSRRPFWNIVQCVQHYDYRALTEPELRFLAMQTLAFGGRGLLWYTYWYPGQPNETVKHAMMNFDGKPDATYEWIKQINGDARVIGDELLPCESWAVIQASPAGFTSPSGTPVRLQAIPLNVGLFQKTGGEWLALVTNRNYREAIKTSVGIDPPSASVQQFDPATKKWSSIRSADGAITLDLRAGGGALLKWKHK
jgi:hypothetical protein